MLFRSRVTENGQDDFVPADDVPGGKGELDPRITIEFRQPDENVSEPGARPDVAMTEGGSPVDGVAIAFYPDGTADAGDIILRDQEGFRLALRINPITARVHVVEMERE